jgi:LmbE family N-acetylglucosaminyl deacetylase
MATPRRLVDPAAFWQGTLLIVAPHMDDELLACGGLIAQLPQKERIHVLYATDGMKSPAPIVPWRDAISPDLGTVRRKESRAALRLLGVPADNLHFLQLPEAQLAKHVPALQCLLKEQIACIQPAHIFLPFRYDRHPDHLVLNHLITAAHKQGQVQAQLFEYFVYYRWRLLPTRDVRQYIAPHHLLEVDTQAVANQKRRALDCFQSQTTKFYVWQTRPILTPTLLDNVSYSPELFLRYDPATPGAAVFVKLVPWIRIVHRLEPFLQRWRYRIFSFVRRSRGTA